MQIKFVNRLREFDFLKSQKEFIGRKNSVVLICGESGVGKSELTKHFISQCSVDIPAIKLSIQQAEKDSYVAGYYITKLARAIHECAYSDSRVHSLSSFLKKSKSSEVVLKKIWESVKTDAFSLIPFSSTVKEVSDLFFEQGDFDVNKFFESTHSDILLALFNYVREECMRISMIINIENIQSIDSRSWELFVPIIKESNNCLFLLEFTDKDNSGYSFSEIISEFENQRIIVDPLLVKPLNIEDVKKIIEDEPGLSWDLIQRSYVDWNGNIRLLIDVLARVKYGLPIDTGSSINMNVATAEHLHSLTTSELFLLTVIHIHWEPVQKSLLYKLVTFKESLQYTIDVHSLISNLEERSLIKCIGDEIMLAHDSISLHLIQTEKYDLFSIIAQKFWLDTYETLLGNDDVYTSRGWRLMKVLYFVSLLNYDSKIYGLLNSINEEALRSRDPEKMISYVQDVRTSLFQKDGVKYAERILLIDYWLIELYYKIGNSTNAWKVLSQINQSSNKFKVLKAILLEQIGRHSDAINFCSYELKSSNNLNPNYELALRLVRLVTNFDIREKIATTNEFNALYRKKRYRELFEYGFLLRNAELVFSYQDSLPYYKKSILHFRKHGALRQAAFSRITYGVHLGLVGKYKSAKRQFDLAEKELGDVISERHTLLNNLAVLLLFQKKIESDADVLLRQAMLTATGDFERLTINMNYLVFMDWKDNRNEVELAMNAMLKILHKPSFADKEIIRYAYFNFYKYFNRIGMTQEARLYREKINGLGLVETPIWKFWLYNEQIPKEDEEFHLSVIDRSISFLCNWNMEYDSSLMHYE